MLRILDNIYYVEFKHIPSLCQGQYIKIVCSTVL